MATRDELLEYFANAYLPKSEAVYRLPVSVSVEEFWQEVLAYRRKHAIMLPLRAFDNHVYWYMPTKRLLNAGDNIARMARDAEISAMPQYAADEGLMDEAYFSSVIEGAYSTKQRAREFIIGGTRPKDKSERMILNNYSALRFVLSHLDSPISEALILEIAKLLTEGTLEDGAKHGYREGGVQVVSGRQEVIYTAPPAEYVKPMMDALLRYIADTSVHPIIKACVTHIYFVTVHPLVDGNGRTARALSYMILLQAGYDFYRQFPISGLLAEQRSLYYKAIRAAQSPDNGYDFTYFIEYYAEMLNRCAEGIYERAANYKRIRILRARLESVDGGERILRGAHWLLEEGVKTITADKWKNKFKVSFETARQDLLRLEKEGVVVMRAVGRKHFFDIAKT